MQEYLKSSTYINWQHPAVLALAETIAREQQNTNLIAKACFEFVRDQIRHSGDHELNPVTCKASDVLLHGTGFCYAKSHLLAALLRANAIPAGLCYQRLTVNGETPPFCLHGLNAVYLEDTGWYRLDARGNKPNVTAEFCPPVEKLAFPISHVGEEDLPEIWPEPLESVIQALHHGTTYLDVANNLPDIQLLPTISKHRTII